jgi:hypothetical protein
MRWATGVARKGEVKHAYSILVIKSERRDISEDLGVNGRIIFEWIL